MSQTELARARKARVTTACRASGHPRVVLPIEEQTSDDNGAALMLDAISG
jgi:hypothetical protein